MPHLPPEFDSTLQEIHRSVRGVDGWLQHREMDFLAMMAACPTTSGEIVELGSYRGKSTIVLSKAAQLGSQRRLTTVDPLPSEILKGNLADAGVLESVDVVHAYSQDFRKTWSGPIRLLWHDGDNLEATVRGDVRALLPHMADCGIVAMHDVLNCSGDRVKVFLSEVLSSPHFGATGMCGSIGWAQYRANPNDAKKHTSSRQRLARLLKRVAPYQSARQQNPKGISKLAYRMLRSRVPHGDVDPQKWLKQVATAPVTYQMPSAPPVAPLPSVVQGTAQVG